VHCFHAIFTENPHGAKAASDGSEVHLDQVALMREDGVVRVRLAARRAVSRTCRLQRV
jgi:hypothetical protein